VKPHLVRGVTLIPSQRIWLVVPSTNCIQPSTIGFPCIIRSPLANFTITQNNSCSDIDVDVSDPCWDHIPQLIGRNWLLQSSFSDRIGTDVDSACHPLVSTVERIILNCDRCPQLLWLVAHPEPCIIALARQRAQDPIGRYRLLYTAA